LKQVEHVILDAPQPAFFVSSLPVVVGLILIYSAAKERIRWNAIVVSVVLLLLLTAIYDSADNWVDLLFIEGVRSVFGHGNMLIAPLLKLAFIITINAYLLAGWLCNWHNSPWPPPFNQRKAIKKC
jgi:hypothetical protein